MPKLYEYLGITIFFWSDEHEPIHVHGRYQGTEEKAEIIVDKGEIINIVFKKIQGKKNLSSSKKKDFENFVETYSKQIIDKWIQYFVWKKDIETEIITKKIK
jgi:hypothetical protein